MSPWARLSPQQKLELRQTDLVCSATVVAPYQPHREVLATPGQKESPTLGSTAASGLCHPLAGALRRHRCWRGHHADETWWACGRRRLPRCWAAKQGAQRPSRRCCCAHARFPQKDHRVGTRCATHARVTMRQLVAEHPRASWTLPTWQHRDLRFLELQTQPWRLPHWRLAVLTTGFRALRQAQQAAGQFLPTASTAARRLHHCSATGQHAPRQKTPPPSGLPMPARLASCARALRAADA